MRVYVPETQDATVWIQLGNQNYRIRLYEFRGLTYADVSTLDNGVINGHRVMTNEWILPKYLQGGNGNFRFEAYEPDAADYVHYTGYNTKFRLEAYTEDEMP